jgi:putative phosphoesterase
MLPKLSNQRIVAVMPIARGGRIEARRAAVLSDVHGNATALEAVLGEVDAAQPDLIVFGGDLTWGPLPEETWRLASRQRPDSPVFIRGNADRAVLESVSRAERGEAAALTARERWMVEAHGVESRAALANFVEAMVVSVVGLGVVRFCHGSPRSDEELITSATPEERMRGLLKGVQESVLVSAHTHIQFDRLIAGIRSINPGSVGMPYEGQPGAFWALLGPDVELRRTDYDLDDAIRRFRASGDPLAETMVETLLTPPTPSEVIAHAEALKFSG